MANVEHRVQLSYGKQEVFPIGEQCEDLQEKMLYFDVLSSKIKHFQAILQSCA